MRRLARGVVVVLTVALLAGTALALPLTSAMASRSKAPRATTGGAHHPSDSSVELTGSVNPRGAETSWYFEYGPTAAYGTQTPTTVAGSGVGGVKVSESLTGLQAGATYHYRLVAVSSTAGTIDGRDRTFTTKSAVPHHKTTPKPIGLRFVLPKAAAVATYRSSFSLAGTLSGVGGANQTLVLQASPFPYMGTFTDVGSPTTTNATGGFSFRVPSVSQNTKLRVSTLGAPAAYSRVVTLQVAVIVTLHARSAGGELVRFDGTVAPAEVGAPVSIQLLRTGRKPANVYETKVRRGTSSMSRFGALVRVRRTGVYRAFVRVSDGRQVSGHSGGILIHAAARTRRHLHRRR